MCRNVRIVCIYYVNIKKRYKKRKFYYCSIVIYDMIFFKYHISLILVLYDLLELICSI